MKAIVACIGVLVAAVVLALLGTLLALFGTGSTVAAGERAVVAIGSFDALLWLAACAGFVRVTRPLAAWPRWLTRIGFALTLLLILAAWLLLNLLMFDR